jgi:hypothetical protein
MALSLNTIYKPLSDFFLNHFKSDEESPVFFRFAKIGSVISDDDFIDPNFPGQYSPSLAKEKFSNLVNSIPIEDLDGQSIFFTLNNIDETYHDQLLVPSIPFIPENTDGTIKESLMNSFNQIKADAIQLWDNIHLESISRLRMDFKPAIATPENWYDKKKNELWSSSTFRVEETITSEPIETSKFQLWKLRMNADQLGTLFPLIQTSMGPEFMDLQDVLTTEKFANIGIIRKNRAISTVVVDPEAEDQRSYIYQNFHIAYWNSNVKARLIASQYIKNEAPTQPVKTSSFSITFKYCVINIDRPWLKTSFINDKTWFIPNIAKAQLTSNDNTIVNITELTIGLVVIKELKIEANWAETDIEIAKNATDFGPFEISSGIVNNKLSHEGIQIIGWLLQKMPNLPPNDPPQ